MATLADCFKLHGIEEKSPEAGFIRKEVARYKKDGFSTQEAYVGVLTDLLNRAETEHGNILKQLGGDTNTLTELKSPKLSRKEKRKQLMEKSDES